MSIVRTWMAVAAIPFALAMPLVAHATEASFYVGNAWSIKLYSDNSTATEGPYCSMRTTHWAGKSIAINFRLTALDEVTPEVVFDKSSWALPVDGTTNVRFGIYKGGILQFPVVAISKTALRLRPNPSDIFQSNFLENTAEVMFDYRSNLQIAAGFEGNEDPWVGAVMTVGEKAMLRQAFNDCDAALRKLGPSVFPEALNNSPTSPFAPSAKNDIPPTWEFSKREEDWGETCYVEKKQGEVLVGFMVARGHELEGFVENGFSGSVKTEWKIDNEAPINSEGEVADYFGWHSFTGFDERFLQMMESGKKLTINDEKGTVINIDLNGALTALWEFSTCARTMQ